MTNNLQLFILTFEEYRRFSDHLPVKNSELFTDLYSEADYVGVQVRLMLLRKYFSNGKNPENVSIRKVIAEAEISFPDYARELTGLEDRYNNVEKQQIEHILSDGTKLNLYTTVEDSVYGLYLHADEKRIMRLNKTSESFRFACSRKYVLDVEAIIFELYNLLIKCGVALQKSANGGHASLLYFGDPNKNTQSIRNSPYWGNLYGYDASEEDMKKIYEQISDEETNILALCHYFLEELKKEPLKSSELRKLVSPSVRRAWGNFSEAQAFYNSIPNPGVSSKVRFDSQRKFACVRVFPNVNNPFIVETPHILNEIYEITLIKWRKEWRIYSFGGCVNPNNETHT